MVDHRKVCNHYKHFADASRLRRFNFDLLYRFLLPFRDYLVDKYGFRWTDSFSTFPFDDLVSILSGPDNEMPELFRNGLFFIDELSHYKGTELILYQLRDAGITESGRWSNDSRMEITAKTWFVAHRFRGRCFGTRSQTIGCFRDSGNPKRTTAKWVQAALMTNLLPHSGKRKKR